MPTKSHRRVVAFIYGVLMAYVAGKRLGELFFAPLRVKLGEKKFSEPDLIFLSRSRASSAEEAYCTGADLVVEVVSDWPEDRKRDTVTKRREYAAAGIKEYWIVDPA